MQRKTRSNRVGATWNKGYLLAALGLLLCLLVSACSSDTNSAAAENHGNHSEMATNDTADSSSSGEDSSVNASADDSSAEQPATDDTQADDKGGSTSTNDDGKATAGTEPKTEDSNAATKPDNDKADPKPATDDKGGTKGDSNHNAHQDDSKTTTSAAKPATKPAAKPAAETKPDKDTTAKPTEPAAGDSKAEVKSKTYTVEIKEFAFTVSSLTIRPGDTVKFINRDKVKHTATADDGSFDTGLFGLDEEKSVTFDTEGEFSYYCAPHPAMQATIIVSAK
ncbi:cupredoxin domain-containing protein [Paenibacillus lignilyticus]|uniref:Cupredoxin domain-containing protein n=1 Tax=Paenibacillus lignilyticus TaxID=1172615 RepID=A0ABS5CGI1_9BACL|nr:plastocyanin/azurin family copper-binding protein [Paenibacillus lignilyticus]MBP3964940.1 cupredoxin domain-containing protein [Paenibacillus lignilyticus]